MDWTPLVQATVSVAAAAVPVVAGKVWFWLEEKMASSRMARLAAAAQRAAGDILLAIGTNAAVSDALSTTRDQLVSTLAGKLSASFAPTLKKQGGTQATVEGMIRGELGILVGGAAK
jgi:hypothetical protein